VNEPVAAAGPVPPAAEAPAPVPAPEPVAPTPAALPPGGTTVLARLRLAHEALGRKDLAGAMEIYEEVLTSAGDRPDVLVTISGDLGVTGHMREIIELLAPRYDAQRHGPATGFNLLQAYIAVRDPEAAQHVLDLLFTLNRPELQDRLFGFSNVIADMMLLEAEGTMAPTPPPQASVPAEGPRIDLASISKPIWYYGLESVPGLLPPKEGRLRRIAFGQFSLPGIKDVGAALEQPEDEMGRLSRGFPLWLAETLLFSANYSAVATIATMRREHYGIFNAEWTPEHIRQIIDTTEGGLDYLFTGSLENRHGDYGLVLRVWEVKKFRERKAFTIRWTPSNADQALAQFHAQLCTFMEHTPYPAGQGLRYTLPSHLHDYVEALGGGLTLFLGEKQVLPRTRMTLPAELMQRAGQAAADSEMAALLALGMHARARRLGLEGLPPPPPALATTPAVEQARRVLEF
jgi:hypothetical protein